MTSANAYGAYSCTSATTWWSLRTHTNETGLKPPRNVARGPVDALAKRLKVHTAIATSRSKSVLCTYCASLARPFSAEKNSLSRS